MGLVNAVVDPLDVTHWITRPGLNAYRPALHTRVRLVKAMQLDRIRPQAIVLGTSRSHVALRMSHPDWQAAPGYNLAFDGATPQELYAYLQDAEAVRPLKEVVLGLDTWHLEGNPTAVRPDFDPGLLRSPDAPTSRLTAALARLRLLLSLDTLAASAETLRAQGAPQPDWFAPDGQRLGPVFFHNDREFVSEGPGAYFLAVDRQEIGFKLPDPPQPLNFAPHPSTPPPEDSFDYIRRIVEFCRANAIDLRIFITPAHAHQMEIAALMGEWPEIERGKRRLVALLADDAARAHTAAYPLWDFSGYSSVTTEPVPAAGVRHEMRFYWDSSHFKEEVGDWVLDRLFGINDPTHPAPSDFGASLTPTTLEPVLAEIRAGHARYLATHPADVAALQRMLAEVRAERARPSGAPAA